MKQYLKMHWLFLFGTVACGADTSLEVDTDLTHEQQPVVISPSMSPYVPSLGTGWDSSAESYVGRCVSGSEKRLENAVEGRLEFTSMMTAEKARHELGFSVGTKADFAVASAESKSSASRLLETGEYSMAWVFLANYDLDVTELDVDQPVNLTLVGRQAETNGTWLRDCGDEYVHQIRNGAKLFIIYRLDFSSKKARDEIQHKLTGKSSLIEVNAELKMNASLLSRQARVSINVFQFGGEPWKLGGVIDGASTSVEDSRSAALSAVRCGAGDLAVCESFLANAMAYASSTVLPDGFPKQVERRNSATSYMTQSWSRLGKGSEGQPDNETIVFKRLELSSKVNKIRSAQDRVGSLLTTHWLEDWHRAILTDWRDRLKDHAGRVRFAVRACYEGLRKSNGGHGYSEDSIATCVAAADKVLALDLPDSALLWGDASKTSPQIWGWILDYWREGDNAQKLGEPVRDQEYSEEFGADTAFFEPDGHPTVVYSKWGKFTVAMPGQLYEAWQAM